VGLETSSERQRRERCGSKGVLRRRANARGESVAVRRAAGRLFQNVFPEMMYIAVCRDATGCDVVMQCGKMQQAIDTCVYLNQWNLAIDLAHQHNVRDTEPLLVKYAETLLDKNKTFSAVELYRKANHQVDAAKLLFQVSKIVVFFVPVFQHTVHSNVLAFLATNLLFGFCFILDFL